MLGVLLTVATAAAATQTATAPIVINGKIDRSTDLLLIPVTVGATRVWCAFDTGLSGLIAVDRAKGVTPTADVTVGPIALGSQSIILRDLPKEAPEMECVFGTALLRRYVMEIDYVQPRVRLFAPGTFTPPAGVEHVPLIFRTNPNVPFVRVVLRFADGTEQITQVVADTGAAYFAAVFVEQAAARLRSSFAATASPPYVAHGPHGPLRLSAARPQVMVAGPFTLPEPVVALLESDLGGGGTDDGLLGAGFFRRFNTVTFDYHERRMYLEPNARLTAPHTFDASGVGFIADPSGLVAALVLPGSPAAHAGIEAGDRLLELDDRAVHAMTPIEVRDALSVPGATRTLRMLRGTQILIITLKLEKRL